MSSAARAREFDREIAVHDLSFVAPTLEHAIRIGPALSLCRASSLCQRLFHGAETEEVATLDPQARDTARVGLLAQPFARKLQSQRKLVKCQ